MRPAERWRDERDFHDRQAWLRSRALRPDDYRVDDGVYLDHASWIRPAFARLGDVRGRSVLDLGCGHGMAAVVLARRGARVVGCDVSAGYLAEARRRARASGVRADWVAVNGEVLPFADGAFDAVWGNAVLHHFDLARAAAELHRVLRPGGVGVFCEPWGENRWLRLARREFTYPGKDRTADEEPLGVRDVAALRRVFPSVEVAGHQLLAMASRVVRRPALVRLLFRLDDALLRRLPRWQRYCRYVVIAVRK
jgi:SAM-dependent methyltransferase